MKIVDNQQELSTYNKAADNFDIHMYMYIKLFCDFTMPYKVKKMLTTGTT